MANPKILIKEKILFFFKFLNAILIPLDAGKFFIINVTWLDEE
jgi:hypothetical protein